MKFIYIYKYVCILYIISILVRKNYTILLRYRDSLSSIDKYLPS